MNMRRQIFCANQLIDIVLDLVVKLNTINNGMVANMYEYMYRIYQAD